MDIQFEKISKFKKGTLVNILKDCYSFEKRYEENDLIKWKDFDDFFYDNLDIADKYGLITILDSKPIGFISWDPRNRPDYVEIGYNGICSKYKGNGYGKRQLQEAVDRIKKYDVKKIIVATNSHVIPAIKMYESVGFTKVKETSTNDFYGNIVDYVYEIKNDSEE